jgi:hypothetical protein
MDEVDGMSSGDRGGMAELISFIKKTRVMDGNGKLMFLLNYLCVGSHHLYLQ